MQLDRIVKDGQIFTRIKLSAKEWKQKKFRDMFSLLEAQSDLPDKIIQAAERLRGVQIENKPAVELMQRLNNKKSLSI